MPLTKTQVDSLLIKNFKHIRHFLGLTQLEFGKWLEVGRPIIGVIEEGRCAPTKHLVYKLSQVSKYTLDQLYTTELNNNNK